MRFQIISHAGLLVENQGVQLLTDPWILGSTYWRSWWNFPPVTRELRDSLKPDFIYLTHAHWDHFQGPSLRRFGRQQRILVPRSPDTRMWRDLKQMGFTNVTEIRHGESVEFAPGFRITSYQFNLFMDSALVIEAGDVTLLNANDSKFMGEPLGQILRRHGRIDFVFRSHSSANSRLCYEIIDKPEAVVDDFEHYVRDFANFAIASGCRYAIPFASNHCFLHKDVYRFNDTIMTPQTVADYFERQRIATPEVRIMVSGDSWSSDSGFATQANDFFENRERHLAAYRDRHSKTLERFYALEANATLTEKQIGDYFARFSQAIPWPLRRLFRNRPICYVLAAGDRRLMFEVDIHRGSARQISDADDKTHAAQIHTSAHIMRQCMALHLFSHLAISKRVRYRVSAARKRDIMLLNLLFNAFEYEMIPLRRMMTRRFVGCWLRRWREWTLYARIATGLALRRKFDMARYLPARRAVSQA
jgi:UDP-MurNAc hydroxylase